MDSFRIGSKSIGEGHPCFIIAEAGSNHNGNLQQAKILVDIAVEAGADAVKFQNFKADKLYPKNAGKPGYLKSEKPIHEMIKTMEMPQDWIPELAGYCARNNIIFISTPFDEESADLLDPYVEVFKIASYEMTHIPLLRHVARKGKPLIISTGTANMDEVRHTVDVVRHEGNERIILLQCTASYPAALESLNLRAIKTMRQTCGVLTGLSDHSRDPVIGPCAAVALGACCVEKHFTVSNLLPGPDHKFAVEPDELRRMVQSIRATEACMGAGDKVALEVEKELRIFARRSIFTVNRIKKGEKFTCENIAVLRCGELGYEFSPEEYEQVLNRTAEIDIAENSLLKREHVVW
ncbi:MAG: Spore coat polysaccharide biosynthesis protein SpsE [Pelotomaculum sp. PtaB.Bin104]|nr:MAG: Spore coat polysaccharide biosynthesis protein SpsE [Pelotomaculum sp. PtaB.Bin104]